MFNTYETPHDCFTCFDRLCSARYSSFQYNSEERNRNLENKFGAGAVKNYENLIIEAQKEVEIERLLAQGREKDSRPTMVVRPDG